MTTLNLCSSTAIALCLTATAGLADVTPEQVWQGWQDALTSMGETVTASSAKRNGDTLVVNAITVGFDKNGSKGTLDLDTISFKDNGDGTVAVILPDTYPVKLTIPGGGPDTKPGDVGLTIAMPGAKIIASGAPGAISYKTDAPEMDLTLDTVNGVAADALKAKVKARLTGVTANYTVDGADAAKTMTEDFAIKTFDLAAGGMDEPSKSGFDMTMTVADFAGKFMIKGLPPAGDNTDLAAALKAGFAIAANIGYGATKVDITALSDNKPTTIKAAFGSGTFGFAMDQTKFSSTSGGKDMMMSVTSPDIPIPDASASLGEIAFTLSMPVSKSDTPGAFTVLTKLVDVKIADSIWALIDTGNALPHDPATLIIDTTGTTTLTRDIMADATALENGSTPSPGLLNSLKLNQLDVKFAGAELTGAGAFTFDNSDTTTFKGTPLPTGKIDLKAVGLNALIDKLVAMGIVPKDQAMQGRMMMAMFANTSTTSDEITSTLEFKDKHFFANGQQLQ